MATIEWGKDLRIHDYGLDRGVLYLKEPVPWNGLVAVEERVNATADTILYYDGRQALVAQEVFDYEATLQAYFYPDIFSEHNGFSENESRKPFGLSYRTQSGDGYQIHLVYNATVLPKERQWSTTSDRVDPSVFAWDIRAESVAIPGARPASHLVIDSRSMGFVVSALEETLYGTANSEPRLPLPAEIIELYEIAMSVKITYNGDGTYTADGPDELVTPDVDGLFSLDVPTLHLLDDGRFVVSSSYMG